MQNIIVLILFWYVSMVLLFKVSQANFFASAKSVLNKLFEVPIHGEYYSAHPMYPKNFFVG